MNTTQQQVPLEIIYLTPRIDSTIDVFLVRWLGITFTFEDRDGLVAYIYPHLDLHRTDDEIYGWWRANYIRICCVGGSCNRNPEQMELYVKAVFNDFRINPVLASAIKLGVHKYAQRWG